MSLFKDSKAQKTNLWLPKGNGGRGINKKSGLTDTHSTI